MRGRLVMAALACGLVVFAGCGGDDTGSTGSTTALVTVDVCANDDGALTDAGFVFVTAPTSGSRVSPGFTVSGCSRSFESNVPWQLLDAEGMVLARGATMGGGSVWSQTPSVERHRMVPACRSTATSWNWATSR